MKNIIILLDENCIDKDELFIIKDALPKIGYNPIEMDVNDIDKIKKNDIVFNLVDSDACSFQIPFVLEQRKIKFTGNSAQAMFACSNKLLLKQLLELYNIITPQITTNPPYIVKPIWEHGSCGITIASIKYKKSKIPCHYFAEEYIEGEEYTVSLLGDINLPIRKYSFPGKSKILDFKNKWEHEDFIVENNVLMPHLYPISRRVWKVLGLRGYARIDFRIKENIPYVIDVNTNPLLGNRGAFYHSAISVMESEELIRKIINLAKTR